MICKDSDFIPSLDILFQLLTILDQKSISFYSET